MARSPGGCCACWSALLLQGPVRRACKCFARHEPPQPSQGQKAARPPAGVHPARPQPGRARSPAERARPGPSQPSHFRACVHPRDTCRKDKHAGGGGTHPQSLGGPARPRQLLPLWRGETPAKGVESPTRAPVARSGGGSEPLRRLATASANLCSTVRNAPSN
jgi:hypothetical protein